jgi:predicted lipoprotein with Yx(FWY)xxD motif
VATLLGVAAVAALAVAGLALAASPSTLRVRSNVHVTNAAIPAALKVKTVDTHEAVAVGPAGYAVYTFEGESVSPRHIICKKSAGCWKFWPPVSVQSASGISKASGIKGKLGSFRIHGLIQLTLRGMPLYYFAPDIKSGNKRKATGDELNTFGSIWHIVKATAASSGAAQSTTMSTSSTSTSTNPYPNGWG